MSIERKALVIGIDKYYNFDNLSFCRSDAKKIEELLSKNYNNLTNFSVKMLDCEEGIKRKNLKEKIADLFKGNGEIALLYFSGHGYIDKKGESYLCSSDAKFKKIRKKTFGIKIKEIEEMISKSKFENKIVLLDSCFSGSIGDSNVKNSIKKYSILYDNTTYLTSSKRDEFSTESSKYKGGMFTSLLCEALKGAASDLLGNVSLASVYSYIDKSLGPWDQRPVFKTNSKRFINLRQCKPTIEVGDLKKITDLFPDKNYLFPLDPSFEPTYKKSLKENTKKFKLLQTFSGKGLVTPVNEEHMYWAAMKRKHCKLTLMGQNYWQWVNDDKIKK